MSERLSGRLCFPIFYFPHFIFSFPPSRHFVPFAVKNSAAAPWLHPAPILIPSVVKTPWSIRLLVSLFSLSPFHLFRRCLG